MTRAWYLVKRNWPPTEARCANYAGLGGDVWPLSDAPDRAAREVHSTMLRTRGYVRIDDCEELLCVEPSIAQTYFQVASVAARGAWLLRASVAEAGSNMVDGFDVGFPSGGFSVIETEIINQNWNGPTLNGNGLFQARADAIDYLRRRAQHEELEQLDGLVVVSVEVLQRS